MKTVEPRTLAELARGEFFIILFSPPVLLAMFRMICRGGATCLGKGTVGGSDRGSVCRAMTGRTIGGVGSGAGVGSSDAKSCRLTPMTLSLSRCAVACCANCRLLAGRAGADLETATGTSGLRAGTAGRGSAAGVEHEEGTEVSCFTSTASTTGVAATGTTVLTARRRGW